MTNKQLVIQIAKNQTCSKKDLKDLIVHTICHMGLDPNDYKDEIKEYVEGLT